MPDTSDMSKSSAARIFADMLQNDLQVEDRELTPLDDIFVEQFPPLLTFIEDADYMRMGSLTLSPIQEELLRHFEQVLNPSTYIEMVRHWGPEYAPVRYVNDLACAWGKGSGKDMSIQYGFSRIANILLCMHNPQAYYGMPHHTIIHMLNVAASAKQAHGVFFKPLRTLITGAPWYADKFESGEPPGPQAGEIRFLKQIELISGHSDPETLEGKNLIAGVADEISAFPLASAGKGSNAPSKTADELVDMLRSSATTRFGTQYKFVQISYPRAKGDAILQALATAKQDELENGEKSRYYASGPYRTWDVNPRFKSADMEYIKIPGVEQPVPNLPTIVGDYKKNIGFAKAKYECDPTAALNRFFSDDAAIFNSFDFQRLVDPITFQYFVGTDARDDEKVSQWQCRYLYSGDFTPVPGALYSVHGDMAITGDRAGVALAHTKGYRTILNEVTGRNENKPIIEVDYVGSWEADASAVNPATDTLMPREIQLRWFRQFIMDLIDRGFPVVRATMDGFQSADSLQILAARGIEAEKVSLDRTTEGYDTLKDVMYEGRLDGYWNELVVNEISALNKYPNGKIDHLPGGSKDLADALAGAVLGAVILGGQEEDPTEPVVAVHSAPAPSFEAFGGWGAGGGAFGAFGSRDVSGMFS